MMAVLQNYPDICYPGNPTAKTGGEKFCRKGNPSDRTNKGEEDAISSTAASGLIRPDVGSESV
tara:strand:- start:345 stop:533 length:189 start_codon:yes stop_codon:yes gene_type:complete